MNRKYNTKSFFILRDLFLGGVPEWPKGADCNSAGSAYGGSNPPPSTKFFMVEDKVEVASA